MRYAAVQHRHSSKKWYWFYIPEELEDRVCIGSRVICDTANGQSHGFVVNILEQVDADSGEPDELKPIVAVYTDMQIDDLYVPCKFLKSKPSPDKIKQRVEELYTKGRFYTRVAFRYDGVLLDGYTAYLVAKAFNFQLISGLCVIGKEDVA